ncbi:MAG TPA: DNA-protecting protein DprA, partial [Leclercia adecarboxylata]|nr:DNA-protecting protein DprA [Leclercia adecarboxylata]
MTSTEIWLRLISIGELYGDKMVAIAQQLQREPHIDNTAL